MTYLFRYGTPIHLSTARKRVGCQNAVRLSICTGVLLLVLVSSSSQNFYAQKKAAEQPQKLPAAEKIVESHLKALGGKKRVALIRDHA